MCGVREIASRLRYNTQSTEREWETNQSLRPGQVVVIMLELINN